MPASRPELSIDADVLMNLVATGIPGTLVRDVAVTVNVCPRVEAEANWVEGDSPEQREAVDVPGLAANRVVIQTQLSAKEAERFVALAVQLDDGEAQALAIAEARGLTLATDDRKATRIARELGVPVIGTPEIIVAWAAQTSMGVSGIAEVVLRIERRAHFRPRQAHPLREEWDKLAGRST